MKIGKNPLKLLKSLHIIDNFFIIIKVKNNNRISLVKSNDI